MRVIAVDSRAPCWALPAAALAQGISRQADPADRAAGAGQRDRHGGAHPRRRARAAARPDVIVENKPGGALTIGIDLVAKSAPDGYTLGIGPIGALAITRHMVAKLPYNIERDFPPIALIARGHLLLAVVAEIRTSSR